MLFTKAFLLGAAERAVRTAAQSLLAVFVVGVSILDIDVKTALAIAATAVVASLLTSIGSAEFVAGKPTDQV